MNDQEPLPVTSAASPDVVLGAFRLIRELGRGGMGTVHLAEVLDLPRDTDDDAAERPPPGTRVAVKTFHPHLVDSGGFERRARREAKTGAAIRHENVVRTFEAGTAEFRGVATHYMVMEYVEGQTLRELVRELGRVPLEFALTIARQVAAGLEAVHAAGVTHRDLKPENVIITSEHRVKLMDLGVAKVREASIRLSLTGQFLGSVHYAAPEQFRNPDAVDHRADLYALGVLLHEMLSGENPFLHSDIRVVLQRAVTEMPRRLALLVPGTPPVVDQLVWSLVQKDPDTRLAAASVALDVLLRGEESAWWRDAGSAAWSQSGGRLARRMDVPRETPLVGRDAELAELRRAFDAAAGGERRTMWIEGEAGVGKTRLVDEFAAALVEEGVPVRFLFGTSAAPGTGRPFHVYAEALRGALEGISLDALLPPDARRAEFAAFLRGEPSGQALPVEQIRSLFAACFRSLARQTPLLLFVDDLHLAGENSVNLLGHLAHEDPTSPLLVIAAFRPPEETHPLAASLHATRDPSVGHLRLQRLAPKDVGTLLRHVLKSERLVQELGFRLLEKTEGNPLFLLEALRALQQDGSLARRDDGAWTLASTKVEIHVPDTVKDLIRSHLARLSEEDRDLLDVAAVIGMEFDPEVLSEVLGVAKIPLFKRLSQLERKHRLIRSVGKQCRFDHHQLQETLASELMEGLREEYHGQIGECLERRRGAGRPAEEVDGGSAFEVAWHLVLGGRIERAAAWIGAALRHAAQTYRIDDGVTLAARFLDGAESAGSSVPPETRVDVLIALVGFHEHEGRREEELRRLDRAAAETVRVEDVRLTRRVRSLRLSFHFQVGDHASAIDACREALAEAIAAGDRDAALCALGNLGCAQRGLGHFDDAAASLERALAEFCAPGAVPRRCLLVGSLGLVEFHRGRARAAQRHLLDAMALAAAFGIRRPDPFAVSRLPADPVRGRFDGLARALSRSAESRIDGERMLLVETGLPRRLQEAAALLVLGVLAGHLDMTADAHGCLLGALDACRECGDTRFEAALLQALGDNALLAEDLHAARLHVTEALEIRRRIGYRPGTCESLLALGRIAVTEGELAAARPLVDEAAELAHALQMPALGALACASAALLHAREGRAEAARAELLGAREALVGAGPLSVSSRAEGLWFAALAARGLGDEPGFRAHADAAWRTVRDVADRMAPAERRAFLAGGTNREIVAAAGASGES